MRSRERDRGGALLVAVVIVLIVVGLGGAFLTESVFRSRQAMIESQADEGQRLIDAALAHSRRMLFLYKDNNTWNWNDVLTFNQNFSISPLDHRQAALTELRKKMSNDLSNTCLTGTTVEADWDPPTNRTVPDANDPSPFGRFIYYNRGVWHVVVRNNPEDANPLVDTDNRLLLYITATMFDGVQRSFEAYVEYVNPFMMTNGAVMTGGTIKLHGSGKVNITPTGLAQAANVMSNTNIIVQGNVDVNGNVEALGTVTTIGSPTIRGDELQGQPRFDLPTAPPSAYFDAATMVQLRNDGTVIAYGVTQTPEKYGNFEYKRAQSKWTLTGNGPMPPAPAGQKNIFYIQGDLDVSGHPQINATLLVEGSVDMTGSPTTTAQADIGAEWQNLAIYAGGDVRLGGTVTINGVVVAREQVSMSGNVTVTGSVVAIDKEDTHSLVTTRSNLNDEFAGTVSVIFPGPKQIPLKLDKDTLDLIWVRKRP